MFKLYKKSLVAVLGLSLALGVSNAQIPVTDGAHITKSELNSLKELAEMAKQLEEAQRLYTNAVSQLNAFKSEAQNMKNRLEGFSDIGSALKNKEMSQLLNDFIGTASKIDTDKYIRELGGDVGMLNSMGGQGGGIKSSLSDSAKQSAQYQAMIKQLSDKDIELNALRQDMKNATTPQKREEMANVIALEQVGQKNRKDAMELEVKKQAIDADAKKKVERANFINQQMTLPSYLKP